MGRPKKNQHIKLQTFTNPSGAQVWKVTGTMPDGTRIRENFQDKPDALQRIADLEIEAGGMPDVKKALKTLLSPEQLSDAEAAVRQLGGVSLSKVVSHYLNLRDRAREKGTDLDQAISFFENRYRPEITEITILNAKDEYLKTRHGISDATRSNYEVGLLLLLKPDPNKLVHAFTVGDLETSLIKYTNTRSRLSLIRTARRPHALPSESLLDCARVKSPTSSWRISGKS